LSRYLSEALGADEIKFRHALGALERRSGHPNHDIRLSSTVLQNVRLKLKQLGLDVEDTTAQELYYSLNHKLQIDDVKLTRKLRELAAQKVNAEANISDGLVELLKDLNLSQECLAIKPAVLKSQLKKIPPKKVMKALGYRSVDSMLKLEPMALLLLAINDFESEAYVSSFYAKYKKYSAANLELRKLQVIIPKDKKWRKVLLDVKKRTGLTVVSSYELASVVVLPVNNQPKSGYTTMLVSKLLSELSVILSVSSYLKLHQVSSDFGLKLMQIAEHEPYVEAKFLENQVSWKAAQHVLSASTHDLYSPHLSDDDLKPVNLVNKLSEVLDSFKFWEDSDFLALVKSAEATSLNVLDVATNLVNNLPFENRHLDHCRHALMQELMKLYVRPEQIIDSAGDQLDDDQKVLADTKAQALY
jgi:hypothetical protein